MRCRGHGLQKQILSALQRVGDFPGGWYLTTRHPDPPGLYGRWWSRRRFTGRLTRASSFQYDRHHFSYYSIVTQRMHRYCFLLSIIYMVAKIRTSTVSNTVRSVTSGREQYLQGEGMVDLFAFEERSPHDTECILSCELRYLESNGLQVQQHRLAR
ncbi:hypothetical protein F5B20DRAFT_372921 [Whalleya microplaca]|nr:hypothetical protein F5B20DRAFT_372921 [Whalleya microplaca]